MPFWPATVVSSNPINSDNAHSLHQRPALTMRIDKVKWITAHNYGRPKYHAFTSSLGWNVTFFALTLSLKMGPRKQTTEPKLLILVSFFSGEVTPYTDTSHSIHILWDVCHSVFSGSPCISMVYQFEILTIKASEYVVISEKIWHTFFYNFKYMPWCVMSAWESVRMYYIIYICRPILKNKLKLTEYFFLEMALICCLHTNSTNVIFSDYIAKIN